MTTPTTIFGIDIANFQEGLDLSLVKDEGFDFVWAKVSEGDSFRDWCWPGFRDDARACGLLIAGYHYVRTGSADAQADLFCDQLGDNSIPAMLDFEDGSGDIDNFWAVHDALTARGIHVALSYIPRWYWQRIGSPDISGVPTLIQSSYVGGSGPAMALYPGDDADHWDGFGGRTVDILQFTDAATVGGMQVDANAFRGTRAQLAALLGAPEGDDMQLTDTVTDKYGNNIAVGDLLAWIAYHTDLTVDQLGGPGTRDDAPADFGGWPQLGGKTVVDSLADAHTKIDQILALLAPKGT